MYISISNFVLDDILFNFNWIVSKRIIICLWMSFFTVSCKILKLYQNILALQFVWHVSSSVLWYEHVNLFYFLFKTFPVSSGFVKMIHTFTNVKADISLLGGIIIKHKKNVVLYATWKRIMITTCRYKRDSIS